MGGGSGGDGGSGTDKPNETWIISSRGPLWVCVTKTLGLSSSSSAAEGWGFGALQ